jgi:hypothetical protein
VVWRRELGVLGVNWADILDGEIVNAAWAVAGMVAKPRTARKVAASLDTAAWADTERLIRDALAGIAADPGLPELSEDEAAALEAAVRGPETQGALQALLAVRLTDAPETDAARAREAVRLALVAATAPVPGNASRERRRLAIARLRQQEEGGSEPATAGSLGETEANAGAVVSLPAMAAAARLSEYFDDKISALVATLEGQVGFAGLAQVRAEAYNARIVALLGAIERQVAALGDPGRRTKAEAEFLDRYRRQAHQRHGFLTPPDFDRRRLVPVPDIYVPTGISEEDDAERMRLSPDAQPTSLKVWDLAARLNRTVLLGDPGGGKTTAANVLTDRFADDGSPRVAFLVTLREYAARVPIEWSVAEHIEHNLNTLYQSPAPEGLVERLLLTGRAVVIFDGLDELLDTSRRRDVSDRVEQFCSAYPLTPVLVTSRVVGYDQARLDDTQFSCYRLGGFGDDEVAQYAGKWFGTQEGLAPAEAAARAAAFLEESAHATDLRGNPLLLSLMCILYRGAGSLPGDRAGIYARCAELLLRKWDEQRDLYRKLGSDHLVEPTLRYLAWWLFTREDSRTAATERELVAKAAEFLYERGYETEEQAVAAAREFVEFCRGRMWVFSDAGTTADGEKLYGFTHRTFLEYFAAGYLAVTSESPEDLARTLGPRIAAGEWATVAELAVKLKSSVSDRGADRVYAALLDDELGADEVLEFLTTLLPSVRPSPGTVRRLTRAALDRDMASEPEARLGRLVALFAGGRDYQDPIGAEMSGWMADVVTSDDARGRAGGLRLAVSLALLDLKQDAYWHGWAGQQCHLYRAQIAAAAVDDQDLRALALYARALSLRDALAMPGGLTALATVSPEIVQKSGRGVRISIGRMPYLVARAYALVDAAADAADLSGLTAIGEHLMARPKLPWVSSAPGRGQDFAQEIVRFLADGRGIPVLEQTGNLGMAAVLCIAIELGGGALRSAPLRGKTPELAPDSMRSLAWYITGRYRGATGTALPDLPVPAEFRPVFHDWTARQVSFVGVDWKQR